MTKENKRRFVKELKMAKRIIIGGVAAVALIAVVSLIIQRKGDDLEVGQKQPAERRISQEGRQEQTVREHETAEEAASRRRIEALRRGREAMRSGEDTFGGELLRKRFGASARQTGEPNAGASEQE
jgi:hypothetical protein